MMSNSSIKPSAPRDTRRLLLQLVTGGIAGALAMSGALLALDKGLPAAPSPDQVISIGVGVVYILMGLFVSFGAFVPALGAKLLNVADSEELRDEKQHLVWSSLVCLAFGVALVVAALASPAAAMVSPAVALGVFVMALVVSLVAWRQARAGQDEFRKVISAEASQAALALVALLFGGWALLAQLGYAAMFTPLAFLSGLFGLILCGAFGVVFQRGLIVR